MDGKKQFKIFVTRDAKIFDKFFCRKKHFTRQNCLRTKCRHFRQTFVYPIRDDFDCTVDFF